MKIKTFLFFCFFLTACQNQEKNIRQASDHHKIALSLLSKCDKPRALVHLLKAKKLHPKDFLIRHSLGVIYYSMGQYHKALVELKKILKRQPKFTEARVNIARIYIDLNLPDQSLKEIRLAEQDITYTNYLKIINQKALAYYNKGDYAHSKKWLEEALSVSKGKNCFVYLHLGKTETALGNLKQAEQLLKTALSICGKEKPKCEPPEYEEQLALAQLYIKKGNKNRAKYHLNLFLLKSKKRQRIEKAKKLLEKIS